MAYYGSNTTIEQGAAGIGEYFSADGLGEYFSADGLGQDAPVAPAAMDVAMGVGAGAAIGLVSMALLGPMLRRRPGKGAQLVGGAVIGGLAVGGVAVIKRLRAGA